MPTARTDSLDAAVEALAGLATPAELKAIGELRARLAARRLRILVAGEAKRGKSTLVNQLLGAEVLPTGAIPVTAVATTVRRDPAATSEQIVVHFLDGDQSRDRLEELANFVTERGNPGNERGVRAVEVLLGAGPLDEYRFELVDTPGTGSVFEHNTAAARDALGTLDAAIVVLTADPPISAAERDLLHEVSELSVRTFVLLNKADQLDRADLAQAVEFTETVCSTVTGAPARVFACSARTGAADPGYARFAAELERYLATAARADVDAALRGHLARLAEALLDAAVLTERSLQLAASDAAERVRLFGARIEQVSARRQELDDRCWAMERGLRRDLDQSAAELVPRLARACREGASKALDGPLNGLPTDEIETRGRALVVEQIRDEVDRWRAERADLLDAGLVTVCERAAADLDNQLRELRDAGRDLLDITLTYRPDTQQLRDGRGFWYAFDRPIGLEPPLAVTVRRLAPGRARRARARVLDEIGELVDRQVGRARAHLQRRLQESIRTVVAALRDEHQHTLDRMRAALSDAATVSASTSTDYHGRRSGLDTRLQTLRSLLRDLRGDPR